MNRVLQRDLENEKNAHQKREQELREQLDELKRDNDRQQDLIGQVRIEIDQSVMLFYPFRQSKFDCTVQFVT